MNLVQPIRDIELTKKIAEYLKEKRERDYILFVLGIGTGLRISDLLKLKVRDVEGRRIAVREKKTGKYSLIRMPPWVKKAVREYVQGMPRGAYLFPSRIGKNQPLTRHGAYKILRDVEEEFNLEDSLSCHVMRKTFGYHHYQQYKNVLLLQRQFNHSDPKITLRYIGIEQDTADEAMQKFKPLI